MAEAEVQEIRHCLCTASSQDRQALSHRIARASQEVEKV